MIYALLKALFLRPRLLAEHLNNYGELFRVEMWATTRHWAIKAMALLVFAVGMLTFLILAGVAAMVGVMQGQCHWVLLAVPGIPLLVAVVALAVALRKTDTSSVDNIKQQFVADMRALSGPAAATHKHEY